MVPMNPFAGQQWRYRQQGTDLWTQWEGEGGMNGESSMETYTVPYIKCKIASGHLLYHLQS